MADKIVVDSINDAFNAKYQKNGVLYASNIDTINKRDEAGNIIFKQDNTNSVLIIEAITENITNESVLKVVDTQFNYFKFPARTNVLVEPEFDLGINPEDFQIELPVTPPIPVTYSPAADQVVIKSDEFSTLEFSKVNPVTLTQETTNAFTVTQEVLDLIPTYLKFSGTITTLYNSNNNSRVQFTIQEYDANGTLLPASRSGGFEIPVYYPDGTEDEGKVKNEGTYTTTISLVINKTSVVLGHTYRVVGRTDDSNQNRFHTVLANDTNIKITGI